ncbi:unnamed protein product, partial [Urochloa humidicola]
HPSSKPATVLLCLPLRLRRRRVAVTAAAEEQAPDAGGFLRSVLAFCRPPTPPPRFLRRLPLHPRAVSSSFSSPLPPPPGMEASYKFGPYKIDAREVFHATSLSYAMVNLRPLLPGHILLYSSKAGTVHPLKLVFGRFGSFYHSRAFSKFHEEHSNIYERN